MMVCLRPVHSFRVFPGEVTQETDDWQNNGHNIEDRRGEESWDYSMVLGGEANYGGDSGVDGNER